LPRPSSALKPSHPPDGVFVVGPYGGIYWRLMNTLLVGASLFGLWWCHVELSRFAWAQFTLHSCIIAGAELHLIFDGLSYIAGLF
jgi:hypothetical protein